MQKKYRLISTVLLLILALGLMLSAPLTSAQDAEWELTETATLKLGFTSLNTEIEINYPQGWFYRKEANATLFNELEVDHEHPVDEAYMTEGYSIRYINLRPNQLQDLPPTTERTLEDLVAFSVSQYGFQEPMDITETSLVSWTALQIRTVDNLGNHIVSIQGYFGAGKTVVFILTLMAPSEEALDAFLPTLEAMLESITINEALIDVNGHGIWIECSGSGSPTVIFGANIAGNYAFWRRTSGKIAEVTRVCVHGRPTPVYDDNPRPVSDDVEDYRTILSVAKVDGPYILVSAYDGWPEMLHAFTYPDEVVGLVMVDHWPFNADAINLQHDAECNEWTDEQMDEEWANRITQYAADWGFDTEPSIEQMAAIDTLGDLPLVILIPELGGGNNDECGLAWHEIWTQELQPQLADYSTNSTVIVLKGVNHNAMPNHNETVDAIIQMVEEVRLQSVDIDVNGRTMHLECMGRGSPTVILEPGPQEPSGNFYPKMERFWRVQQERIADFTRVCLYNWVIGNELRTVQDHVDDSHEMLTAAGVDGPYVLVGYLGGGLTARVYAGRYPEEMAGMVLLDPDTPEALAFYTEQMSDSEIIPAFADAGLDYAASMDQVSTINSLGDLPLIVFVPELEGNNCPVPNWDEFHRLQTEVWLPGLASLSSNGTVVVLEGADHGCPSGFTAPLRPEIADAIQQMVEDIRAQPQSVEHNDDWTPIIREFDGVEMALVPSGRFMMGLPEEAKPQFVQDCGDNPTCQRLADDSGPVHEVSIDHAFWIDVYEVTNAQFEQQDDPPTVTRSSSVTDPDYPRNYITWTAARDFCELRGGRLPTEAEWEYAARGPDSLAYPWGDEFDPTRANYCDASCESTWRDPDNDDGYENTSPVGAFSPAGDSWVGAADMAGNVSEWTSTIYSPRLFPYPYVADDGRNDMTDTSSRRVMRGGAFQAPSTATHAGFHTYSGSIQGDYVGFRCVRDVEDE